MSDRDRVTKPGMHLSISVILDDLLGDLALRTIAQSAREMLRFALAALSFRAPGFSATTSLFVRDTFIMPMDFALCAVTAGGADIVSVPRLAVGRHATPGDGKLRSYAGGAVLDWQRDCLGVFYLMDTKPHRLTLQQTSQIRFYIHLISCRIEIMRRFGTDPGGPSAAELVRLADRLAGAGQEHEAEDLVALAYAVYDIASLRRQASALMPS